MISAFGIDSGRIYRLTGTNRSERETSFSFSLKYAKETVVPDQGFTSPTQLDGRFKLLVCPVLSPYRQGNRPMQPVAFPLLNMPFVGQRPGRPLWRPVGCCRTRTYLGSHLRLEREPSTTGPPENQAGVPPTTSTGSVNSGGSARSGLE